MKLFEGLKRIVTGKERKDIGILIQELKSTRDRLQAELERMPPQVSTTVPGYGEGSDEYRREGNRWVKEIRGLNDKIALLEEKKRHEEDKKAESLTQ